MSPLCRILDLMPVICIQTTRDLENLLQKRTPVILSPSSMYLYSNPTQVAVTGEPDLQGPLTFLPVIFPFSPNPNQLVRLHYTGEESTKQMVWSKINSIGPHLEVILRVAFAPSQHNFFCFPHAHMIFRVILVEE